MITKPQYVRLTIVLLIPLLLFGWWLAQSESLLPHHYVIQCEEFDSYFTCVSVTTTESEQYNQLNSNRVVTLFYDAILAKDFNHPIVTIPLISGSARETLNLHLPPNPKESSFHQDFSRCNITPYGDNKQKWMYSCSGIQEDFQFSKEETNQKFREAIKIISTENDKNNKTAIAAIVASLLTPLILYILLSASLFAFAKIIKYVIQGRTSKS